MMQRPASLYEYVFLVCDVPDT